MLKDYSEAIKLAVKKIQDYEGYSSVPYMCSASVWTVGYGEVILGSTGEQLIGNAKREVALGQFKKLYPDGITKELASKKIEREVIKIINKMELEFVRLMKDYFTNEQIAALVSFSYNVGNGWIHQSGLRQALLQYQLDINSKKSDELLNEDKQDIQYQIKRWDKVGGVSCKGLKNRREKEASVF